MEKIKSVIDYKNLSKELLELFEDTYPDGLAGKTIRFPNAKGEIVTAARLETEDRIYLVKINTQPKETYDSEEIDDLIPSKEEDDEDEELEDIVGEGDESFDDDDD